jgi:hypothetical protein
MKGLCFCAVVLPVLGGCNLINANGLSLDYSFDAEHFTSPNLGDAKNPSATVPSVACSPTVTPDPCAAATSALPMGSNLTFSCGTAGSCVATAELRLLETVDFSKQMSFPKEAVQYGIDAVDIKRVAYFVMTNTLNVPVPAIDIYVAPHTAKDETDAKAVRLGTVASLPAKSVACADPIDSKGDSLAGSSPVCDVPLTDAGKSALASFAKDYKTPFQVIAHSVVTARAGDPLPTGSIDFYVRPTVGLSILK